jgi:hypothetical protein
MRGGITVDTRKLNVFCLDGLEDHLGPMVAIVRQDSDRNLPINVVVGGYFNFVIQGAIANVCRGIQHANFSDDMGFRKVDFNPLIKGWVGVVNATTLLCRDYRSKCPRQRRYRTHDHFPRTSFP